MEELRLGTRATEGGGGRWRYIYYGKVVIGEACINDKNKIISAGYLYNDEYHEICRNCKIRKEINILKQVLKETPNELQTKIDVMQLKIGFMKKHINKLRSK